MAKRKTGKHKLPKRVAGVKLPRDVRKAGGALIAWAISADGRKLLAPAVMGLIAVLQGTKTGRKMTAEAASGTADAVSSGATVTGRVVSALTEAAGDVVKHAVGLDGDKDAAPARHDKRGKPVTH